MNKMMQVQFLGTKGMDGMAGMDGEGGDEGDAGDECMGMEGGWETEMGVWRQCRSDGAVFR